MVEGDTGRRLMAVGGEHEELAKHVYRVAAEYELPATRCDDIYTAVADLAADRKSCALVVGPLRELARENGHFFRVAARQGARCAVLLGPRGADGRDDVLMAVRAGAWVMDTIDEILGVVETWLAGPVCSPGCPAWQVTNSARPRPNWTRCWGKRLMGRLGHSAYSPSEPDRVLLVGDIDKAFLDADWADRYPCDIKPRVLDAIEAAAQHDYRLIAVVMAGLTSPLGAVLKALRRWPQTQVILLAQMVEEPIARRLVAETPGQEGRADAYCLCPLTLAGLIGEPPTDKSAEPTVETEAAWIGPALETRIRYLERLATTDDLTGLKNRRYLWEFARQVLERAQHTGGRVTLLVFDIDNFKHYNDVYGHPTGDQILRQAAILMQRCCRPHDVVGRIGGDEFAVVFWDDPFPRAEETECDRRSAVADHPKEVIFVAKRFQKEFGNAELDLLGPDGQGVLTISGALASFPGDGATIQELFERADAALLEAKRSGKNRIYLVGEPANNIADLP